MRTSSEPIPLVFGSPFGEISFSQGGIPSSHFISREASRNFNDECFALSESYPGSVHEAIGTALACDTALWGYKHIRLRRFYWQDKKLLMQRIFRSVNLTLWQKRRETGFSDGVAVSLLVVVIGTHNVWIGNVGSTQAILFRGNDLIQLVPPEQDAQKNPIRLLGIDRSAPIPNFVSGRFDVDDIIVCGTQEFFHVIPRRTLIEYLSMHGVEEAVLPTLTHIFNSIIEARAPSTSCMFTLIKRIAKVK